MAEYYILDDDNQPVRVANEEEWAAWTMTHDRAIGYAQIGVAIICTVFLGIHEPSDGERRLFETNIEDGQYQYRMRYTTREEAVAGHARAVAIAIRKNGELAKAR